MADNDRGLYPKFDVKRADGSSEEGRKHEYCEYFVLDLDHDPYAVPALTAYARACMISHPKLAQDLHRMVDTILKRQRKKENGK